MIDQAFYIGSRWDGTSKRLDKRKHYHDSLSLPDADKREIKAGTQQGIILQAIKSRGPSTPSEVHRYLGGAYLIGSIRRSMTNLTNFGFLRKDEQVPGPLGSPETKWVCP